MNTTDAMKALERLGNERHRKTFARHGVRGPCFGVPYAELSKLRRTIGTDQKLAGELWATGNHDARILAALVADPESMTAAKLDAWARAADNQLMLDAVAALAARSPAARRCMERWIESPSEWTAAAGWHLLGTLAGMETTDLTDEELEAYLDRIEAGIHASPNRVRYSMNCALIAIGVRSAPLRKKALAAAKRIGRVEVDHGDTACKTPDAAAYIEKVAAYRQRKAKAAPGQRTAKAGA